MRYEDAGDHKKGISPGTMRTIHFILLVICAIINFLSIYYYISSGVNSPEMVMNILAHLISLTAIIFGFIYVWNFYGKNVAVFYEFFFLFLSTSLGLRIMNSVLTGVPLFVALLDFVALLSTILLAIGRDLGKKNSWIIFGIHFTAELFVILYSMIKGYSGAPADMFEYPVSVAVISFVVLSTIALIIHGKYSDKEARHRKGPSVPSGKEIPDDH